MYGYETIGITPCTGTPGQPRQMEPKGISDLGNTSFLNSGARRA